MIEQRCDSDPGKPGFGRVFFALDSRSHTGMPVSQILRSLPDRHSQAPPLDYGGLNVLVPKSKGKRMKNHTRHLLAIVAGAVFVLSGIALGQGSMRDTMQVQGGRQDTLHTQGNMQDTSEAGVRDSSQGSANGSVAPDNTGINKRDRNDSEVTADEQGQSPADIDMTQKIRRAIMEDDSLSTYAKNVKIITRDGMVTLKGPVRSEQEKTAVEQKASTVAGTGKIKNEMEVKATTEHEK
jgi:hyperosmotically inducible periplasmic protein